MALPLLVAARDKGPSAAEVAAAFALKVAQGQDVSASLVPDAILPAEKAELDLLSGCTLGTMERLPSGRSGMPNFGAQWNCPAGKTVARTAAVIRVKDGMVRKVLMSNVEVRRYP